MSDSTILQITGAVVAILLGTGGLIKVLISAFRNANTAQSDTQKTLLDQIDEIRKDNEKLRAESEKRHEETQKELKESKKELEAARVELARAEGVIQTAYRLNKETGERLEIANQAIGKSEQIVSALTNTNLRLETEKTELVNKIVKLQEELNEQREAQEAMSTALNLRLSDSEKEIKSLKLSNELLENQLKELKTVKP